MNPVGTYERFLDKIKGRESNENIDYFGVLLINNNTEISDEISDIKNHILNYMEDFNSHSDKYFDFYIPGFICKGSRNIRNTKKSFSLNGESFIFDQSKYSYFIRKFREDFNIKHPYNPTLILLQYKNGDFKNCEKVEFDLECVKVNNLNLFFGEIFDIAKQKKTLKEILTQLEKSENFYGKISFANRESRIIKNISTFEDCIKETPIDVGETSNLLFKNINFILNAFCKKGKQVLISRNNKKYYKLKSIKIN